MSTQNIKNKNASITVRRLNNPSHLKGQSNITDFCITDLKVISENAEPRGIASLEECHQLVSPSFIPYLEAALPFKSIHTSAASFGGAWFWEGYRHALFGEDIIYHLGGSSNSLMEDRIDSQKELRNQLMSQKVSTNTTINKQPSATDRIWLHGSAKLEVMYAIALSIALHTSHQPLMDQADGPHALILCASKYQCDEMAFILNQFCDELHLVVHNLFEPFPSIPSSQRADVVVGTPPLWDSVAELGKAWDRRGLEGIISNIHGGSPPPTYTLSKWRPYSIRNVSQLALFDLELQINIGFGRMLVQILTTSDSNLVPDSSLLPLRCQTYSVFGGDRPVYDVDLNFTLLEILRSRGKRNEEKISEISIQSSVCFTSHTKKRLRLEEPTLPSPLPSRKILSSGLLIRNAVSFSRLLVDSNAFQDFVDGILDKAAQFWINFDPLQTDEAMKDSATGRNLRSGLYRYIKCIPVFVCTTEPEAGLRVQEMCTLLIPEERSKNEDDMVTMKSSRYSLLFSHLEEQLNGELFDGSVVSCVNFEDILFRNYQYEFVSVEGQTMGTVDLFQGYFSELNMAQFLLTTHVAHKDDEYIKEVSRIDLFRNHSWILLHSNSEVTFDILTPSGNEFECIPSYACLTPVHIRHTFTVVVLRNVAKSIEALCRCQASIRNEESERIYIKPFALFLLEECCQYGRVVSYYCFEQDKVGRSPDSSGAASSYESGEEISEESFKHSPTEAENRESRLAIVRRTSTAKTATIFIEFESHDSALEAVRLLRERFHSYTASEKNNDEMLSPRVHLFRNTTYYSGVEQDLKQKKKIQTASHEEGHENDILDFCFLQSR
ncbi:unnamed protein product [Phytomonas sp. EM1]|nr:unnamed protein product [Phytomonas sp. EM1]|eukprot:CCW61114.1 unnamed protein product [Phytomonas sp. isolate EM1]